MLTIWIVEDNDADASHLQHQLEIRLQSEKIPFEILRFQDASSALAHEMNADLVFMDIELNRDSGLDLACTLKNRNPKMQSVLTSSHPSYSIDGYRTGALRFLLKPVEAEQLDSALPSSLLWEMAREDWVEVEEMPGHPLPVSKMIYLESMDRSTMIHTSRHIFETSRPLKNWRRMLEPSGFVQCYKSILVSLSWIESMDLENRMLVLKNKEKIPFSRHYRKEVQERLREYIWNTF